MLREETLFGLRDKVAESIKILQEHATDPEGYYFADSGGKDSAVCRHLLQVSGVKFDAHHSLTTIDPPELIYFLREHHPDTVIHSPAKPFLQRLVEKGYPTRQCRWCCKEYKETGGAGRTVVTGVRAAESSRRAKRWYIESCNSDPRGHKWFVHPIFHWTEEDVWEYIRQENIPYCKLYDEGFSRIGCLLCPMAGKHRLFEAERYPVYVRNFIRAFERLYEKRKSTGKRYMDRWKSGEEMFWWWLREDNEYGDPDQGVFFE